MTHYPQHFDLFAGAGISELALPADLDEQLAEALDGEHRHEIRAEIEDEVGAKLREHGVTDEGEWLGQWSAEDIVRDILARR